MQGTTCRRCMEPGLNFSVLYLQVVQALLESADEVGNLLVLQGQRVGDLTQRFLKKETKYNLQSTSSFQTHEAKPTPLNILHLNLDHSGLNDCWFLLQPNTCSFHWLACVLCGWRALGFELPFRHDETFVLQIGSDRDVTSVHREGRERERGRRTLHGRKDAHS